MIKKIGIRNTRMEKLSTIKQIDEDYEYNYQHQITIINFFSFNTDL